MSSSNPRIKTTLVGSYPIPDWLAAMPTQQGLMDATRAILHTQEKAGIDVVCDGEMYRFDINHPETNGMIEYFVRPMGGIRTEITFDELVAYRARKGMGFRTRPPGVVDGPIHSGQLDLPDAAARAMDLASQPLKFTVTGPHMLAKTLIDNHYGDLPALTMAIAEALAQQVSHVNSDYLQLDEANLPGHAEEWQWALAAINKVLDAARGITAVHLCFGNYGGQSIQSGSWDRLMQYLNGLHVDHIVMEMAHRPTGELAAFKELNPGIGLGLGVVDVKQTTIESADSIARAIEAAEKTLGPGRVTYIHPDCGFWMLKRPIADAKIRALVTGRDLYEGRS